MLLPVARVGDQIAPTTYASVITSIAERAIAQIDDASIEFSVVSIRLFCDPRCNSAHGRQASFSFHNISVETF